MLNLADKDCKVAIINTLKELKETMFKELKYIIATKPSQIRDCKLRDRNYIHICKKRSTWKIIESKA